MLRLTGMVLNVRPISGLSKTATNADGTARAYSFVAVTVLAGTSVVEVTLADALAARGLPSVGADVDWHLSFERGRLRAEGPAHEAVTVAQLVTANAG